GRLEPSQRGLDVPGDGPRVLGVEPVVGVAEAMYVGRAPLAQPWRLGLEQLDVSGGIEVVPTTGQALVASSPERSREPRLVIEPDTHEEIGRASCRGRVTGARGSGRENEVWGWTRVHDSDW